VSRVVSLIWRLTGDARSTSALEFALIAPVMIVMFLGTIELSEAIRVQARLNMAAGQLMDMVAGQSAVTMASADGPGGTLGDMCTAASYNMLPYNPANLGAMIESTTVNSSDALQQNWLADESCPTSEKQANGNQETNTLNLIAETPNTLFSADGKLANTYTPGFTAVSLKLFYTYNNVLPFLPGLGPTIQFTAVAAARPRSGVSPTCTYPDTGTPTYQCPYISGK